MLLPAFGIVNFIMKTRTRSSSAGLSYTYAYNFIALIDIGNRPRGQKTVTADIRSQQSNLSDPTTPAQIDSCDMT